MRPDANTTWMTFTLGSGTSYDVYAFEGVEQVHAPYEFLIELVDSSSNINISSFIGEPAYLTMRDRSGEARYVHGLIRRAEQLHTGNTYTHYRCYLVPRIWFFDKIIDHRIFQHKSVVEIIQDIFEEQGLGENEFSFKLFLTYQPREYCVQYGETTLHFISRLCEEEGIYYYFEHSEENHCVCFCDREGGPPIPGENSLRYFQGSGEIADTSVISRLSYHEQSGSNAATYREWYFEKPRLKQEVKADSPDLPVPAGMQLEQYRYPHLYHMPDKSGTPPGTPGKQYVDVQMLRQLTYAKWIQGESDVARLIPSYVFSVTGFPRSDVNTSWWVTKVVHSGEQPQVLEHEAPERGLAYKATFTAIPEMTRFVPEAVHTKRPVICSQTAIVTGPEGEEIFPDAYGRVKVQFFWDREGAADDKSSCWIRVAQGWAGPQYGVMAIPRIGHEVIVEFLEGNPDRPLITGRAFHAGNMPPYELPKHKTRTVFRSLSTPGEEGEKRGFNELRIEDKKGEEEIFVQAEKDVNAYVKNDWKEYILRDSHYTVDNFSYSHIQGDEHVIVDQPRKVELLSTDNLTVRGDYHADVKQKLLGKAGQEIHLQSGMKMVVEGGADVTLKVGGSFVRLTPSGVVMQGASVKINSGGSPGSGSGASPQVPATAKLVEEGTPLQLAAEGNEGQAPASQANALASAARENKPFVSLCSGQDA